MLIALSLALHLIGAPQDVPAPATSLPDVEANRYRSPVGETYLVERAELSPDGTRVAYVAALANNRHLRVQSLDGRFERTADLRGLDVRDVMWAGDDHVLLTVLDQPSDQPREDNGVFLVLSFDVRTNSWETLLRDLGAMSSITGAHASRLPDQPRVLPITFERPAVRQVGDRTQILLDTITFDGSCRYDLYSVDPSTGAARLEDRMTQRVQAMVVSADGRSQAVVQGGKLRLRRGAGLVAARAPELAGGLELLGAARTPDAVLVRVGPAGAGRLLEISGPRGETATPLPTDDLADPMPLYDDQSGRLLGVEGVDADGLTTYHFFDETLARAWPIIAGAFPGDTVSLASWSADMRQLLVYAERADGADYHLVDVATMSERYLAPSWPEPARAGLDRTGARAEFDIRRAAAARIQDARLLCRDLRGPDALRSQGVRPRGRAE